MIEVLKALADETRLRILSQLLKSEMCVCEIEHCLKLTQSNASRHLTVLKKAGVLSSYKKAQWTYFKMSEDFIDENKELYNYLLRKISTIPSYNEDCDMFQSCRKQDICNNIGGHYEQ